VIRAYVAALLLVGCAAGVPTTVDSAVAVVMRNDEPACSAFAISPHELLTASHCVGDDTVQIVSRETWIETSDGYTEAQVVSRDEDRDVVVLQVPTTFPTFFRMREPQEGETVFAIGGMFDWRRSTGTVQPGAGFFRDSTITIKHGWSGSPVIGADGFVVGLIHSCHGNFVGAQHFCLPNNATMSVLP
jgi:S1-C subfamily serine protease